MLSNRSDKKHQKMVTTLEKSITKGLKLKTQVEGNYTKINSMLENMPKI